MYGQMLEAPYPITKVLTRQSLSQMNGIQYDDLWCAACLLHPGFMNFYFVCTDADANYIKIGECLVRCMMSKTMITNSATASANYYSSQSVPEM